MLIPSVPEISGEQRTAYENGYLAGYAHQVMRYGFGTEQSLPRFPQRLSTSFEVWVWWDAGFDEGIDAYHRDVNS